MNVAYLNVTCGLRFHLFFFFFRGAGLLMSFHGHSCPSIMIICIQPQTWGARGHGCVNGTSQVFFLFVFLSKCLGWCPPGVGALSKLRTLHILCSTMRYWFLSSTISFISHRPDHKATLASDLKGAGAWAPPPPCAHHCWKVYKGFRETYAPLQTMSISGKALCISAGQCKTTYCSYYNSMAS